VVSFLLSHLCFVPDIIISALKSSQKLTIGGSFQVGVYRMFGFVVANFQAFHYALTMVVM